MKLSVIIVNYNVRYFLEQVLRSVQRAARGLSVEVFVVDNNSKDDSVAMVREQFPDVQLIVNQENTGFAKANNQAIRASSGAYILLLNPDTVVAENTFTKCLVFMDLHPEAGGLGVRMIDGAGKFLPESKRGFPSPWVAFCKTFGLSGLFPKSRIFNHYHLGYLPEDQTHEVEVLAGAFMLLRRSVLDEIGLLDEAFFMYGEDIDWSYRIVKAGYKNYYFPETTIIHYKGESTKKGSLNYVRVFYQAMIIFARKHFQGGKASLFVLMLQMAIYLRAFLTLISNIFKVIRLPLWDAAVMYAGLYGLKVFWSNYYYKDSGHFDDTILYFNFPLYVFIWLTTIYFSGGYDESGNLRRLVRGLAIGTVLIAAVYGFLDMQYRSSRAIIAMGAVVAIAGTVALRMLIHFLRFRNFNVGKEQPKNLVIIGSKAESERGERLLQRVQIAKNQIGIISPKVEYDEQVFLGSINQLADLVRIYNIEEIIFCSKDLAYQDIIGWMSALNANIEYKILPENSQSIIGSSSKNTAGELYTVNVRFKISAPRNRRSKRTFDILLALFLLVTLPVQLLIVKNRMGLIRNIFTVLGAKKSWAGYIPLAKPLVLPKLKPGVLTPADAISIEKLDEATQQRLNFFYAKDYKISRDITIVYEAYRALGKR